jgi:hypothetical protein
MNNKISKKAISEIVSITLLLLVGILVFISLQSWYFNYIENDLKNTVSIGDNSLEILSIHLDSVYIKNKNEVSLYINELRFQNGDCVINQIINGKSIQNFSIEHCNLKIDEGIQTITLFTEDTIITNSVYINFSVFPRCVDLIGGDWISISENTLLGTSDFCVMKYEAKATTSSLVNLDDSTNMYCGDGSVSGSNGCLTDGSVNITSKAEYRPLSHIYQTQAKTLCENLGANYTLISNLQWVTIAREIESNSLNWFGGSVGTNFIYSGHDDRSPNYSLNATSDDNDPYYRTSDSASSCDGGSYEYPSSSYNTITGMACVGQKRTLYASNNDMLWDFSGNVYEWTSDTVSSGINTSLGQTESPDRWKEWTLITGFDYLESFIDTYNSSNGIGQVSIEETTPYPSGPTHAFFRGGSWDRGSKTGIYTLSLGGAPLFSSNVVGFRCVYNP